MSVAENLSVEELTLFTENCVELMSFEMKIFKLSKDKLYGLDINQDLKQETEKAEEGSAKVLARTTMQTCMQKMKSCNNNSRAVDVILRILLDLLENKINHYREVQFKVVENYSRKIENKIKVLQDNQVKIVNKLHDINHPERAYYLDSMVRHFAENVAKILVIDPIDDDELKVALCMFELYYKKLDWYYYQILEQKLSKGRVPAESIAYRKILNNISNLETDVEVCRNSYKIWSCLRTI